jgi:hypothetical protein
MKLIDITDKNLNYEEYKYQDKVVSEENLGSEKL